MFYVFDRAGRKRTCETRSARNAPGYELVVTDGGRSSIIERFDDLRTLEHRQSELRYAWLSHGWRTVDHDEDMADE